MSKYRKLKLVSDACCRLQSDKATGVMHGKGKSACGFVMLDETGEVIAERTKYLGELTVPQAEYEGLIFALDTAVEFCRTRVEVWMDSEFVIRQMTGDYCIRSEHVKLLFDRVKLMEQRFLEPVQYFHHDRGSLWARRADKLANEEYSRNHTG